MSSTNTGLDVFASTFPRTTRVNPMGVAAPDRAGTPRAGLVRGRSWAEIAEAIARPQPGRSADVCVIRHGQTTLNALHLISGDADTELTRAGRLQAVEAGRQLAASGERFDLACSSHLQRSRETLAIICAAADWDGVRVWSDPRLGERSLGELERRPAKPIAAFEAGDLTWRPPGGESYAAVALRLFDFLVDLLEAPDTDCQRVLLCSHVGPMRLIMGMLNDETDAVEVMAYQLPNLAPLCFRAEDIRIPAYLRPIADR